MIQGVKKFSELLPLTTNGTERLPAIQNVGGVFVNGYIDLSSVSNIYTADGTLTGNRTVDQDGNKLWFKNGQMVVSNTDPMVPVWKCMIIADTSGVTTYGLNVIANSTGISSNGGSIGVRANSTSGIGLHSTSKGNVLQDFSLPFQNPDPTSLLDVFTNEHGTRPFPRLTTAQRDAIASPANYLTIVNTDTHRVELYHPTFGWVGMSDKSVSVQTSISNVSTTLPFFAGTSPTAAANGYTNRAFKSPFTGKITKVFLRGFIAGVLGDRLLTVSIRINNTTDYLVSAITPSSANLEFINTSMNTTGIDIIENVTTLAVKLVASGGTTDSTQLTLGGSIVIQ